MQQDHRRWPGFRRWRGIMGKETITLELSVMLSEAQWRWVATTRIPVQSLRFVGDQRCPVPKGAYIRKPDDGMLLRITLLPMPNHPPHDLIP